MSEKSEEINSFIIDDVLRAVHAHLGTGNLGAHKFTGPPRQIVSPKGIAWARRCWEDGKTLWDIAFTLQISHRHAALILRTIYKCGNAELGLIPKNLSRTALYKHYSDKNRVQELPEDAEFRDHIWAETSEHFLRTNGRRCDPLMPEGRGSE